MTESNEQAPTRIHVTFDDPAVTGMGGESVWAVRLGDGALPDTGLYRIDNIPFFIEIKGFAFRAIVECDESDPERIPEFMSVVTPSMSRTLQVLFIDGLPNPVQLAVIDQIKAAGGSVERGAHTFWAIDVPFEHTDEILEILETRATMDHVTFQFVGDE